MKDFVPHKQSLELKELGFDEECLALFSRDKSLLIKQMPNQQECEQYFGGVLAPTFSQAFRWFREKYDLEIILRPDSINLPEKKLREYVILSYNKSWVLEPIAEPHWWIRKGLFKTPEEAELECLIKLIDIVKTK